MTNSRYYNLARPTAEVLDWLNELFLLMDKNRSFCGDGRDLVQIGEDLKLDTTALMTVAARTPQKSALKLFRLLYPTTNGRARLVSISNVEQQKLKNIYCEFLSTCLIY